MIDLQLHTTDSDGTWRWNDVLERCLEIGLKAFAITDHDTIVRHAEIQAWAQAKSVLAIPGIELSTKENGQTVHLLGYFLDGPLGLLEERLRYLLTGRRERNTKIVAKLQQLGVSITEADVMGVAGSGTVGRPHIARALLQKGIVRSIQEAFDRYLATGGSAYVPKEELPLREAIDLLHRAGGVTSVAHPGLLKRSPEELESSLKEWRAWGLDGIESYYPMYTVEQSAFFHRIANKYGFVETGGTDFHGANKPHIKIGVGTGAFEVPDSLIEPLLMRREERAKEARVH